ncbi:hypothetical protein J1614_008917 [Plenodomus biglobosus]|nr:hypothetical protein J1614_008917 [Plenodomus biglobosus]
MPRQHVVKLECASYHQLTTSGIGLGITSALYQNGASKVYILGRRLNVLQDAIKTLESSHSAPVPPGGILTAITCDVTDLESVKAAAAQVEQEVGHVDVLINNAGVMGPKNATALHTATSITQVRDAMISDWPEWDTTMKINTQSVIGVSAIFLPLLEAANTRRGWTPGKVTGPGNPRQRTLSHPNDPNDDDDRLAHIITIASVASHLRHVTAGLAYNASKSGAAHLGKILATFLAQWGIRSNIVCPGPYPSAMTHGLDPRYGTCQVPQGRMGRLDDIAALMLYLVGKGGAYVDGGVLVSDGGRMGVFPSVY